MTPLIKTIRSIISIPHGGPGVTDSAHARYLWLEFGNTGPAMPPKHGID